MAPAKANAKSAKTPDKKSETGGRPSLPASYVFPKKKPMVLGMTAVTLEAISQLEQIGLRVVQADGSLVTSSMVGQKNISPAADNMETVGRAMSSTQAMDFAERDNNVSVVTTAEKINGSMNDTETAHLTRSSLKKKTVNASIDTTEIPVSEGTRAERIARFGPNDVDGSESESSMSGFIPTGRFKRPPQPVRLTRSAIKEWTQKGSIDNTKIPVSEDRKRARIARFGSTDMDSDESETNVSKLIPEKKFRTEIAGITKLPIKNGPGAHGSVTTTNHPAVKRLSRPTGVETASSGVACSNSNGNENASSLSCTIDSQAADIMTNSGNSTSAPAIRSNPIILANNAGSSKSFSGMSGKMVNLVPIGSTVNREPSLNFTSHSQVEASSMGKQCGNSIGLRAAGSTSDIAITNRHSTNFTSQSTQSNYGHSSNYGNSFRHDAADGHESTSKLKVANVAAKCGTSRSFSPIKPFIKGSCGKNVSGKHVRFATDGDSKTGSNRERCSSISGLQHQTSIPELRGTVDRNNCTNTGGNQLNAVEPEQQDQNMESLSNTGNQMEMNHGTNGSVCNPTVVIRPEPEPEEELEPLLDYEEYFPEECKEFNLKYANILKAQAERESQSKAKVGNGNKSQAANGRQAKFGQARVVKGNKAQVANGRQAKFGNGNKAQAANGRQAKFGQARVVKGNKAQVANGRQAKATIGNQVNDRNERQVELVPNPQYHRVDSAVLLLERIDVNSFPNLRVTNSPSVVPSNNAQELETVNGATGHQNMDGNSVLKTVQKKWNPTTALATRPKFTFPRNPRRRVRKSNSKKAGIVFPVHKVKKQLKKLVPNQRIGSLAPVYLASVLEYLVAEVVEIAGIAASKDNRKTIRPVDIQQAVTTDAEISQLLDGVVIPYSGSNDPNRRK